MNWIVVIVILLIIAVAVVIIMNKKTDMVKWVEGLFKKKKG